MWTNWSEYTACTGDCNKPQDRHRYRECHILENEGYKNKDFSREKLCKSFIETAKKAGHDIQGQRNVQTDPCLDACTPLEWSPWSAWGPCDATCGKGIKLRTRESGISGTSEHTMLCNGRFKGNPKYKDICDKGKERQKADCSTTPCSKMEKYGEKSDGKYS